MSFQRAEKNKAKLKIGLAGPSGSGKTYSALKIASGMGGRIAVIDTENNSASLYADQFTFDADSISAPYTTDKYIEKMRQAVADGYDILIIDSVSHQWDGDGGILKRKEQVDGRGGNVWTNWAKFTPEHETFKAAVVNCDIHLICTLRSKQDYILSENGKGKQSPTKVGLAPVQRDGFEYELTVMLDMAMDHSAQASKDRTSLFDSTVFKPSEETGANLMKWLKSCTTPTYTTPPPLPPSKPLQPKPPFPGPGPNPGTTPPAPPKPAAVIPSSVPQHIQRGLADVARVNASYKVSQAQIQRMWTIANSKKLVGEEAERIIHNYVQYNFHKESVKELNRQEYDEVCDQFLKNYKVENPAPSGVEVSSPVGGNEFDDSLPPMAEPPAWFKES